MKTGPSMHGEFIRILSWLLITLLLITYQTAACPLCKTESGRQVREGIFNQDFGSILFSVLAPFPIMFGIIAIAYWAPSLYRRKFLRKPTPPSG